MLSRMKAVSAGIGIAGTAPLIYSGYWLHNRTTSTGIQLLEQQGYTFNKPALANGGSTGTSCSENLFKDSLKNDQKVYGCMTARMKKSNDNKGINFNSEVAIRKGNQGWVINARINNSHGGTSITSDYLFSEWNKNNESETKESWYFFDRGVNTTGGSAAGKKIYIKTPENETAAGYDSNSGIEEPNKHATEGAKFEEGKDKEYRGVGISDDAGDHNGIFEKLKIGVEEEKYAEVFGTGKMDANDSDYGSKESFKITPSGSNLNLGSEYVDKKGTIYTNIQNKIKTLIAAIKDIKGKGINMDDVCGYGYSRNIGENEKKNLKMFCSKKI